jgi:amphi-Trp domain-containing protein
LAKRKTTTRASERDVEVGYSTRDFVEKLRRLADALERGGPFVIQVANERIRVPAGAVFNVEHERAAGSEEVEFQLKWSSGPAAAPARARRPTSKNRRAPSAKSRPASRR